MPSYLVPYRNPKLVSLLVIDLVKSSTNWQLLTTCFGQMLHNFIYYKAYAHFFQCSTCIFLNWTSIFSGHYGRILLMLKCQNPTLAIDFIFLLTPWIHSITLAIISSSYFLHSCWPIPSNCKDVYDVLLNVKGLPPTLIIHQLHSLFPWSLLRKKPDMLTTCLLTSNSICLFFLHRRSRTPSASHQG